MSPLPWPTKIYLWALKIMQRSAQLNWCLESWYSINYLYLLRTTGFFVIAIAFIGFLQTNWTNYRTTTDTCIIDFIAAPMLTITHSTLCCTMDGLFMTLGYWQVKGTSCSKLSTSLVFDQMSGVLNKHFRQMRNQSLGTPTFLCQMSNIDRIMAITILTNKIMRSSDSGLRLCYTYAIEWRCIPNLPIDYRIKRLFRLN